MTRRPGSETTGLLREDGAQGHVPFAAQPARDAIRASMAPHSARRMLWLSSAGRTIASPAPGQPSIVSSPHPRRKGLPHLIGDRAGDGPRDGGGVSPGQQPPPSLNKEPALKGAR